MHTARSHPFKAILKAISTLIFLCICIPLLTSCESRKTIVNNLDEKDANDILVFLDSKRIIADKVKAESAGGGGAQVVKWNITVHADEASEAMRLLNQQGLPRRPTKSILELYSSSGLVPSDVQEQIKYHAALGEQLANTVRKYDGVLDAEVQISFPKIDALNPERSKGKITASVWVKHSGILDDPNSHLKSQIQRLVSSSITGLQYDNVTVIGERSRLSEDHSQGASESQIEKQYVRTWGIVIAEESHFRFQILFFTFCILLLLMLLTTLWILWRTLPIFRKSGGLKALISTSPLHLEHKSETKETESEKAPKTESTAAEDKAKADKNVDET